MSGNDAGYRFIPYPPIPAAAGGTGTVTNIATAVPITGGPITTTGTIGVTDFVASGASHARGTVPDPGSVAGTTKFLREDATWQIPGGSSTSPVADLFFFGDGTDGNLTVSSGVTTLTRDTYYNNVTISGTASIKTTGFRLYIAGILDITAAPASAVNANGAAGSGHAAIAPISMTTVGTMGASTTTAAPTGGSGVGTTGSQNVPIACGNGGIAGNGGAGGSGTAGAGGVAKAALGITATFAIHCPIRDLWRMQGATNASMTTTFIQGGSSSASGSSGSGNGAALAGGDGGGAAAGGNVLFLAAKTINRGGSTAAGALSANGGAGAAGSTVASPGLGGGGGGGGAGGGWVFLIYGSLTGSSATGCVSADGGIGGAGGNGTVNGGDGGGGGTGGTIQAFNIYAGTGTITTGSAGSAGGAHSTTTGGTGGTAGTCGLTL